MVLGRQEGLRGDPVAGVSSPVLRAPRGRICDERTSQNRERRRVDEDSFDGGQSRRRAGGGVAGGDRLQLQEQVGGDAAGRSHLGRCRDHDVGCRCGSTTAARRPASTGKVIIWGSTDTPVSYDPAGSYDLPSWNVVYNVYQTLLRVDEATQKPVPDAATGCTSLDRLQGLDLQAQAGPEVLQR